MVFWCVSGGFLERKRINAKGSDACKMQPWSMDEELSEAKAVWVPSFQHFPLASVFIA